MITTHDFASLRTARLVNEAIDRAIAAGHELDALNEEWRAIAQHIQTLTPGSHDYADAYADEQRITGKIVHLERQLGVEVPV